MEEVTVAAPASGADCTVVDPEMLNDAVPGAELPAPTGIVDPQTVDPQAVDVDVVAAAELGGVACVDALAASRVAVVAAEVTQVRLVAAWADLCNGDSSPGAAGAGAGGAGSVLAGMEQVVVKYRV